VGGARAVGQVLGAVPHRLDAGRRRRADPVGQVAALAVGLLQLFLHPAVGGLGDVLHLVDLGAGEVLALAE
jgi:hypothetical protein